ncbi:glycosyltransferase [Salinisphaera sp. SPP-AMP-43]|uniref:glycosyltransferase n=1 Tax=Salinisphaera sp. SPP-AMP-43 TaxID=3121288 RepID=UPI003C6E6978
MLRWRRWSGYKKVLYVDRFYPDKGLTRREEKRRDKSHRERFRGQDGFFRAALHSRFRVTEIKLDDLMRRGRSFADRFDYIVVCSKADSSGQGRHWREFNGLADITSRPKALFLCNERADYMPDDQCLDRFDVVFKREPFRDLERYNLQPRNRDKIRKTWLSCQLVPTRRDNIDHIRVADYSYDAPAPEPKNDVFFAGKQSSPERSRAWARILASDLRASGGIQPHNIAPDVAPTIAGPKLKPEAFQHALRDACVDLALEGTSEFSHRHLEIWLLTGFCLSSPSIRELSLPGEPRENEHFVCYDDHDDLIDKIRFYAEHREPRERIAQAGHDRFMAHYDFRAHGTFIERCLSGDA